MFDLVHEDADPREMSDAVLAEWAEHAARRGLCVDRRAAELVYEQMLRGQIEAAKRYLRLALYPNGGCDTVALRVGSARMGEAGVATFVPRSPVATEGPALKSEKAP